MMVAEDEEGSEGLKVVGFACWLRTGDEKNPKIKSDTRSDWSWKGLQSPCRHFQVLIWPRDSKIFRSRHNSTGLVRFS